MWFAVAVVGGAVLVGGCSKDRKLERQLRGTWNASGSTPTQQTTSSSLTGSTTIARTGQQQNPVPLATLEFYGSLTGTYTFNKDNTGKANITLKYTLKEDGAVVMTQDVSVSAEFTYEVKDKKLHIKYNTGREEVYIIVSAENNKVVLKQDDTRGKVSYTFVDPDTGEMVKFEFVWDITLTK